MKKQDQKITLASYLEEIDRLRPKPDKLTDLQYTVLVAARETKPVVLWKDLTRFWKEKGWGEVTKDCLSTRYYREKARRECVG